MDNLKVEIFKNIDSKTDFAIVYDRDEKHFIDLLREEYLTVHSRMFFLIVGQYIKQ